jgi:chromosome segregation protein
MRIRRLELFGFKSFCDRTAFTFGEGISCVVGPNGSGKSNVVDALKWVIGEQSARSLRGAEMQDVIFAGSANRKPVGFAEVQLTLLADEGEPFPGEYASLREVQVGRRLHRSGTSEYLINQVRCRRRDVVDLFLDTGIGTNLYSFIEQGRVDKVVSATPPERRELIDEAAGISRYKQRRAEARSRLEATVQQLDRAADVADEMARRLGVLEKQVVKAAKFRRLRARVRQRETFLGLVKYRGLAADRRALQAQLREGRAEEAAARRGLMRREEDLRARREEVATVDEATGTWRDELAELDARLRELASQQELQGKRAEELAGSAAAAREEAERARVDAEQVAAQRGALEQELAVTEAAAAQTEGSDGEAEAVVQRLREELAAARQARDLARRSASEAQARTVRADARVGSVAERLAEVPHKQATATEALEQLMARREAAQQAVVTHEAEVEASTAAVGRVRVHEQEAAEALAAVEAEVARLRTEHDERVAAAMAKVSEARRRLAAVETQQARARKERARQLASDHAAARRARDEALAAVQRRGRQWVEAVASRHGRRLRDVEQRAESARAEFDDAARRREAEARAEGEARAREVVKSTEAHIESVLGPLRSTVKRERQAVDDLVGELQEVGVEVATVDATIAGLEARLKEEATAGATAPSLVDSLEPDAALEALQRLGRRASLPVLRDAPGIVAARERLRDGEHVEVFWDRGDTPPPHVAPDLASALAHHEATGGAARVEGSAERVDADGTVTLARGEVASPAARRLAWRKELDEAQQRSEALQERRERLQGERSTRTEALQQAEQALADAEREAEGERRRVRREAFDEAERALREVVERNEVERETVVAAHRERVAEARRASDEAVAGARAAREAAEAQLRAELDQAMQSAEQAAEARAAEGQAAEEQVHADATRRVDEALAAAEAVRSAAPPLPSLEEPRSALAQAREATAAAARTLAGHEQQLALAKARLQGLVTEHEQGERRLEQLAEEARRLQAEHDAATEEATASREALVAAEQALAEGETAHDAASEAVAAAERALASARAEGSALRERLAGQRARVKELVARQEASERQRQAALERAEQSEKRAEEAGTAATGADEERTTVQVARDEAFDRLERERARGAELRRGMAEAESDREQLQERLRKATAHVAKLVEDSTTVRAEIDAVRQRLDDRYQVSLPGLLDRLDRSGRIDLTVDEAVAKGLVVGTREVEPVQAWVVRPPMLDDEDAVRQALDELETDRAALQRMGEVHLGAMEEYEELAQRHGELATQREDLEASVSRLRAAIAKMNRTCRERFREAFDRVNEHFQESYPQLLGGGAARLALTDDEDLLETGVEIFVQPPGKRLQSLSLLSGGEKAMTAIALLIALFRVRPSPFCVLDEVDAPLDERNGGRFNGMLRDLARTSQFVVITHNRKTMECADTLYGVSMTTPGVSSLVSVAL